MRSIGRLYFYSATNMKDSALIIFTDPKGLVFLQQKTYDAPNHGGLWCLFGGGVEPGETALEAAVRETKEELTLDLPASEFKHFRDFPSEHWNRVVFVVELPDNAETVLKEGRGMGYFRQEEIAHLQIADHVKDILPAYFNAR